MAMPKILDMAGSNIQDTAEKETRKKEEEHRQMQIVVRFTQIQ